MSDQYEIIVIGDGLAARTILAAIDYSKYQGKVLQVFQNKCFPPASLSAGAIASTYGARKGISPLGDLNVEAYESFKKFIQSMELKFSFEKMQYFIDKKNNDPKKRASFQQRWTEEKVQTKDDYLIAESESVLFDPIDYLDQLLLHYKEEVARESRSVDTVDLKENEVTFKSGERIKSKYVLDCTGAYSLNDSKEHKMTYGAYRVIPYICESPKNFLLNLNGVNILYHHKEQKLVIGATTQNEGPLVPDLAKMQSWQKGIDYLFSFMQLPKIEWERSHLISGLRSKAKKRMPVFKWDGNAYQVYGLYKNGLMYSAHQLKVVAEKIAINPKIQL